VAVRPAPPGTPPGRFPVALPGAVRRPAVRAHRADLAQSPERRGSAHPRRSRTKSPRRTQGICTYTPDRGREACSAAARPPQGPAPATVKPATPPPPTTPPRLRSSPRSCPHTPRVRPARHGQAGDSAVAHRLILPRRRLRGQASAAATPSCRVGAGPRRKLRRRHPILPRRRRPRRSLRRRLRLRILRPPACPPGKDTRQCQQGIRPANKIRASTIARGFGFRCFWGLAGPGCLLSSFREVLEKPGTGAAMEELTTRRPRPRRHRVVLRHVQDALVKVRRYILAAARASVRDGAQIASTG